MSEDTTAWVPSDDEQPESDRGAPVNETGPEQVEPSKQERRDERWRGRALTAETRLSQYQERDVLQQIASFGVGDARLVWREGGVALADVLNEDGDVDVEALREVVERV